MADLIKENKRLRGELVESHDRLSELLIEVETLNQTISDLDDELIAKQNELVRAYNNYEVLDQRYQILIEACQKLMREDKNAQSKHR